MKEKLILDQLSVIQYTQPEANILYTPFTLSIGKSRNLMPRLEAGVGELEDGCPLVRGPLLGDDGRVADQGEMDSGERDEVRLVLVQVHVKLTAEPQAGRDGGYHLRGKICIWHMT